MTSTAVLHPNAAVESPPRAAGLSERAARAVTASVLIAVLGAFLSYKLEGRFAISNLAQIAALVVLVSSIRRLFHGRDIAFLAFGLAGVLAAGILISNVYGVELAPEYTGFFALVSVWLLGVYRACREHGASEAVFRGFRWAIPIALLYVLVRLGIDLAGGTDRRRLGFDDKSHASVYCCFLAFAALRFVRGRRRLVYALAFFVVAFLTISRLPFVFAPAFLIAFLIEYRAVRAEARTPLGVYGTHLLLLGAFGTPLVLAAQAAGLFTSFDRFFNAGEHTEASTDAHLLLLGYAAQLKVENLGNFLLGVTPGGFSGVLYRSPIDVSEFAATDPPGYEKLAQGIAPMHSSLGSILLEFPIWIAVLYLVLAVWAIRSLLVRREWVLLLFLISFLAATLFYSSHTELYFFVAWTAVIAAATRAIPPPAARGDAPPPGAIAPSPRAVAQSAPRSPAPNPGGNR